MKKTYLALFLSLIISNLFAETSIVSGKVVDKNTLQPITKVNIFNEQGGSSSDTAGEFTIECVKKSDKIIFQHISYNNNGFSINTISTLDEEVNKVTLDETNAAAAQIFDPNNSMMVVIGNKDSCATFLEQFQDIEYYEQLEELDRQPERFFLRPYITISLYLILPIIPILLVL